MAVEKSVWVLRCLYESGSSPGRIINHELELDEGENDFVIAQSPNGSIDIGKKRECRIGGDIIAYFRISPPLFVLGPITDGVSLEESIISSIAFSRRKGERDFIHLRPDDVIYFSQQQLKVQILAPSQATPQTTPTPTEDMPYMPMMIYPMINEASTDGDNINVAIHVKSSNPGPGALPDTVTHDASRSHDDIETESEEDPEDLDTPSLRKARTPGDSKGEDVTPATSRPTEPLRTKDTIQETPSEPSPTDDNLPFSTAPDRVQADVSLASANGVTLPDPNSPLAKKGDSQGPASAFLDEVDRPQASQKSILVRTPGRKNRQNYSKLNRLKNREHTELCSTFGGDNEEQSDNIDVAVNGVDEDPDDVLETSEPMHTSEAAEEAASRSMRTRRAKRKSSEIAAEQDEAPLANKRSRRSANAVETSSSTAKEESPVPTPQPQPQKRGRKSRPSRTTSTETLEEIVVAANTAEETKGEASLSPQVRIPSTSKTPTDSEPPSSLVGKVPKALLSHSDVTKKIKLVNFLKKQGVRIVEDVPTAGSNFICITTPGALHTTAKLLRSIALGKDVVTDDWVIQSQAAGQLLNTADFIHEGLASTSNLDRRTLFAGKTLFFTNSLYQVYGAGWPAVEVLAKDAGAVRVEKGAARKGAELTPQASVLFFGSEKGDLDAATLVERDGKVVFVRDMLTQSVLRGVLLDGEEFRYAPEPAGKRKQGGKKKG